MSHGRNVKPIIGSPGLFFDKLLDVKFTNNNWNLVTYIDISHIQPNLHKVESLFSEIGKYCSAYASKKDTNCANTLSSLKSQHANNIKKFGSISYLLHDESTVRIRRGLIDAGGSLLKTLFGTLDSDDAVKINRAIQQVQSGEKQITHFMKDNIHVVKSTVNSINNTIIRIKENEKIIDNNRQQIQMQIDQNDKLDIKSQLDSLLSSLEGIIIALSFDVDDVNNGILFSKVNILHPTVLSPFQLYSELEKHRNRLPKDYDLPFKLTLENIHEVLEIYNLICYYSNEKVVVVIQIPLVIPQSFDLYHIWPLPIPYDSVKPNTFALLAPSRPYVAITKDRGSYLLLQTIDTCKTIPNKHYICPLSNIYSTKDNPTCETTLLIDPTAKIPKMCNIKILHGIIDVFQKINNNRWLFVQSERGRIKFKCPIRTYDEVLFGTGIMTLPKYCKAYFKTLQFIPSNSIEINTNIAISNFSIINDDCCKISLVNKTLYQMPLKRNHFNSFNNLLETSNHLTELLRKLDEMENQNHTYMEQFGVHHLSMVYILAAIIMLYALYKIRTCIIKVCWCKKSNEGSTCITNKSKKENINIRNFTI